MAKRLNPNLSRMHYTYTVKEAAELYGVHSHTVRNWIKKGLPVLDEQRPVLIQGLKLRDFIRESNAKQKHPCAINQIYCLACRKPQVPAGEMVDYVPSDERKGCLTALCPDCDRVINKYFSFSKIEQIQKKLDVNIQPIKNT